MLIAFTCKNAKCRHNWEHNCIKNLGEEHIVINSDGKCETFEEGLNELYLKD